MEKDWEKGFFYYLSITKISYFSLQEALILMAFREENVSKLIDDTEFVQDNKAHKIMFY